MIAVLIWCYHKKNNFSWSNGDGYYLRSKNKTIFHFSFFMSLLNEVRHPISHYVVIHVFLFENYVRNNLIASKQRGFADFPTMSDFELFWSIHIFQARRTVIPWVIAVQKLINSSIHSEQSDLFTLALSSQIFLNAISCRFLTFESQSLFAADLSIPRSWAKTWLFPSTWNYYGLYINGIHLSKDLSKRGNSHWRHLFLSALVTLTVSPSLFFF